MKFEHVAKDKVLISEYTIIPVGICPNVNYATGFLTQDSCRITIRERSLDMCKWLLYHEWSSDAL